MGLSVQAIAGEVHVGRFLKWPFMKATDSFQDKDGLFSEILWSPLALFIYF